MPTKTAPSSRTRVRRKPERAHYDTETVHAIVDAALFCSVAFQIDGAVHAIPTLHWRDGEFLYIHGARASRMLKALMAGEACLNITLADGLVLARTSLHHSMNFRSVVVYGRFEAVAQPEEKQRALQALIDGWYPGRWAMLRPVTGQELNATTVLRIPLAEASAKVRDWGVRDDVDDLTWPVWAGVIPLHCGTGAPQMAEDSVLDTPPVTRFPPA